MKIEEFDEKKYEKDLRKKIVKKLDDLRQKISENEDVPHGKQDIDLLQSIDEEIEMCLVNWYY